LFGRRDLDGDRARETFGDRFIDDTEPTSTEYARDAKSRELEGAGLGRIRRAFLDDGRGREWAVRGAVRRSITQA
jgi:hypothetical protein